MTEQRLSSIPPAASSEPDLEPEELMEELEAIERRILDAVSSEIVGMKKLVARGFRTQKKELDDFKESVTRDLADIRRWRERLEDELGIQREDTYPGAPGE